MLLSVVHIGGSQVSGAGQCENIKYFLCVYVTGQLIQQDSRWTACLVSQESQTDLFLCVCVCVCVCECVLCCRR